MSKQLERTIESKLKAVRWHAKTIRELPYHKDALRINTFKNSMPNNVMPSINFQTMVDILCVIHKGKVFAWNPLEAWISIFGRVLQKKSYSKTFGAYTAKVCNHSGSWYVAFGKSLQPIDEFIATL
jgi:hypothetical protein